MRRDDSNRTQHDLCPRCRDRYLPADYPGAMSRWANRQIEICSSCGLDEAIGNGIVPPDRWPVLRERNDAIDGMVGVEVRYR